MIILFIPGFFASLSGFSQQTISSISPTSASPGSSVTIYGSNFSSTASDNIVFFGGAGAAVTAASSSSLTATVPTGALFGPVSVTLSGITAFSTAFFTPTIKCPRASIDTGTFEKSIFFQVNSIPKGAAIADLDGDKKPDLVIPNFGSNNISVFKNTSTAGEITMASFSTKNDISCCAQPYLVTLGDLDGDGKPDMVVSGFSSNEIGVFMNTSSGSMISFSSPEYFAMPSASSGGGACRAIIADMDLDGKPDIVVAYRGKYVCIFQNKFTVNLSSTSFKRTDLTMSGTSNVAGNDIAIADMDGDDLPDILAPDINNKVLNIYINKGSLSFTAKTQSLKDKGVWGIAVADFDGDGNPDIVGSYRNSAEVFTFRNTSSGSFSLGIENNFSLSSGSETAFMTVADLNGDAKPDVVLGELSGNGTAVLINNSSSGTINWGIFNLGGSVSFQPLAGDINGDGIPDIVAQDTSGKVYCLRNDMELLVSISKTGKILVCRGDSFKLEANSGSGIIYQWNFNGSPVSGGSKAYFYAKKVGAYSVTTTGKTCSLTSGIANLFQQGVDTSMALSRNQNICPGDSITMSVYSNAKSYRWQKSGKDIPGDTSYIFSTKDPGAYRVFLISINGCKDSSRLVNVAIETTPDTTVTPLGITSFCEGGHVTLSAVNRAGLKYQWLINGVSQPGATKASYDAAVSGKYSVKITTTGGCFTATSYGTNVKAITLPMAAITPSGAKSFCKGGNVTLTSNTNAGLTYEWYRNGVIIPTESKAFYQASASGKYVVKVTNSAGCIGYDSAQVDVFDNPVSTFTYQHSGFGRINFSADDASGTKYEWKFGDSASGTGKTVFHQYADGTYNVTLKITNANGCVTTKTTSITVNGTGIHEEKTSDIKMKIFPNPFSSGTTISYNLDKAAPVSIRVTNILGQEVATVDEKMLPAGANIYVFTGAGPGNYFIQIRVRNNFYMGKMVQQ